MTGWSLVFAYNHLLGLVHRENDRGLTDSLMINGTAGSSDNLAIMDNSFKEMKFGVSGLDSAFVSLY